LVKDQSICGGTHLHDVLFGLPSPFGQGASAGLLHRVAQQGIRFRSALVGRKEVGLVVEERVDRAKGNEGNDLNDVAASLFQILQFFPGEKDEVVLLNFVTLDHVLALYDLLCALIDVLLLQPAAVFVQQLDWISEPLSVAEYSRTGTLTKPKLSVSEAIERAVVTIAGSFRVPHADSRTTEVSRASA